MALGQCSPMDSPHSAVLDPTFGSHLLPASLGLNSHQTLSQVWASVALSWGTDSLSGTLLRMWDPADQLL